MRLRARHRLYWGQGSNAWLGNVGGKTLSILGTCVQPSSILAVAPQGIIVISQCAVSFSLFRNCGWRKGAIFLVYEPNALFIIAQNNWAGVGGARKRSRGGPWERNGFWCVRLGFETQLCHLQAV